jgi:aryl-alcohol dehydrogenase-like predicted oxidoreductase
MASKESTPTQICLACFFHQGDDIFPTPGTRKISRLEENVKAIDITLSDEDLSLLDQSFPIDSTTGGRY